MTEPEVPGFTVWVDADGMPQPVRQILLNASARRAASMVFVANRHLGALPSPYARAVVVGAGSDVADDYIVSHAAAGDLVVSDDVPLAARAVERGAEVLQFRGRLHDRSNVGEALSVRNLGAELREIGIEGGGPAAWNQRAKQEFANGLDRWLTRAARKSSG